MIRTEHATVYIGNNLDILPTLEDNSIDAIVTDPPYGLSDNKFVAETITRWIQGERDFIPDGKGFMGKSWDAFVPPPALWDECLRVLKPGGHLLAFFGSRTQDIGALSIRLAGFEIRDSIAWMYGSGFPKSLDISKAIDKAAGAERQILSTYSAAKQKGSLAWNGLDRTEGKGSGFGETASITTPSTPEAQQWEGWGTALKPAFEPVIVARKPLIGTVAENVLTYGTGGLNIDGSRVGNEKLGGGTMPDLRDVGLMSKEATGIDKLSFGQNPRPATRLEQPEYTGRWPANVILDPYTAELLDEQSGISVSKSGGMSGTHPSPMDWGKENKEIPRGGFDDKGGASRFFYVAKASKRDRNEGLEELPSKVTGSFDGNADLDNARKIGANPSKPNQPRQNFHPTVKPTDLMRYLIKLVTPPGGTVLDPFTGSGSTGKAAILQGFDFIGIELTEEYLPIIEGRLKWAEAKVAEEETKKDEALF